MAGIPTSLKELYLQKNIPVSALEILANIELEHLQKLSVLLRPSFIKNKIAKEILLLFIELDQKTQEIYLHEMQDIFDKVSEDGRHFLNYHYKNILYSLRFPIRKALKAELDSVLKKAKPPQGCIIKYDSSFEKNSLQLEMELKNEN